MSYHVNTFIFLCTFCEKVHLYYTTQPLLKIFMQSFLGMQSAIILRYETFTIGLKSETIKIVRSLV